jgi:hypothetical protein
MNPTVRAPAKYPVDSVPESAVIADDFGFELLFSVVSDGQRGPTLALSC